MPLIELSDAVNVVEGYRDRNPDSWSLCNSIKFDIAELPTISPDEARGVGEWIKLDAHKGMEQYKCSVCETPTYVPECMNDPMYGYCPNCGARMKGAEDGTTD